MTPRPFNPETVLKATLTGKDRAAMRGDMNKVALKLHEAGIQLYGYYRIHDLVPYWNPLGFDFMCDNWRQLLDTAQNAPRLGSDQIDMPGYDNWLKAGIKSVGFTQTGKPPHVHLDIARPPTEAPRKRASWENGPPYRPQTPKLQLWRYPSRTSKLHLLSINHGKCSNQFYWPH